MKNEIILKEENKEFLNSSVEIECCCCRKMEVVKTTNDNGYNCGFCLNKNYLYMETKILKITEVFSAPF